jgi:hypothetical protein
MVSHLTRQFGGFLKTKLTLTIYTIQIPWNLTKELENLCSHRSLHMDIYSNFIQNCQFGNNKDVFSRDMDK